MNGWNLYVKVAIPRPVDQGFDYQFDPAVHQTPVAGDWVEVPFGRTTLCGSVLEVSATEPVMPAGIKIKSVLKVLPKEFSLPPEVLKLARFAAEYYQYPVGEAFLVASPPKINKKLNFRKPKPSKHAANPRVRELNEDQKKVFEAMAAEMARDPAQSFLLEGVTGSGKTEVYLEIAKNVLAAGKSVLILVPEIALTAQLRERFESGLGREVVLWHSAVAEGLRQHQWLLAKSGEAKVILGARSAIFSPIQDLGLIVVDEEHDATYKQEERFRYHARDLALYRGKLAKAAVVLGSATPSLETLQRVKDGKIVRHKLERRHSQGRMPILKFIQMAEEPLVPEEMSKTPFAQKTVEEMQATIDRGEQVIVFLNRRGFSQFIICRDCGWVKECDQCSISMTHYQGRGELKCHVCGTKSKVPVHCDDCQSHELIGMGSGTESLEEDLARSLRGAKVARLDRDVITSQKRLEEVIDDFRNLKSNVLVGTQMLVKGHDFPKVTCVVVVSVDSILKFPDFRSSERALQTLVQVSGRAGRAELLGQVLLQGYDLDHPVLKVIQGEVSVEEFRESELAVRQMLFYPPFCRFVRYRFSGREERPLKQAAEKIADHLRQFTGADNEDRWLGPSEALLFRANRLYRYDLYFKAKKVEDLFRATQAAKKMAVELEVDLAVDVDPYNS